MTLRFAREDDIPALLDLYGRLLRHHRDNFGGFHSFTDEMVRTRAQSYLSIIRPGGGFIVVQEVGAKIVGMMVSQYLPSNPGMPEQNPVLLMDGYVLPAHQKKGYYREMLEKSIEKCKEDGRGSLMSWIAPENKFIIDLLEKDYGFKSVLVFEYKKL